MNKCNPVVLVTGGNGFIGHYTCLALASHGKNVVSLDNEEPKLRTASSVYLSLKCDITDKKSLKEIFQEYHPDSIIHLASILNTASREKPGEATEVNILGSLNILESAKNFGITKIIYGSSISAYSPAFSQGSNNNPDGALCITKDIYASAKRYVETLGNSYQQKFGIKFTALRISHVVGSGALGTASPWRREIFDKLNSVQESEIQIPYDSNELLPLIHVEDVADMFEILVNAEYITSTAYDTPSETWNLYDLAGYLQTLNKNIKISFGQKVVNGLPAYVHGYQFLKEFNYEPVGIKRRLQQQVNKMDNL